MLKKLTDIVQFFIVVTFPIFLYGSELWIPSKKGSSKELFGLWIQTKNSCNGDKTIESFEST